MNEKSELETLRPLLTQAIQAWMDGICQSHAWLGLNAHFGYYTASYMSDAALAVLAGIADVQYYLRNEQVMEANS